MLKEFKHGMKNSIGADILKFLLDEDDEGNFIVGIAYMVDWMETEPQSIEYIIPQELAYQYGSIEKVLEMSLPGAAKLIMEDIEAFRNTAIPTGE